MDEKLVAYLEKMIDPDEKEAYYFADKLGEKADEEVKDKLLVLLRGDHWEHAYLASRALAKSPFKEEGLEATIEAVFDKKFKSVQGAFAQVLELYNLEFKFVDILKIYLFGNFKASQLAEGYLNEVEFDISPRTIRKAEKHWNHYLHNPEDDGSLQIKKDFVEPMLLEMKDLFSE